MSVPTDTLPLPGGGQLPLLGFGTWQLTGAEATRATAAALAAGYRHVDTAKVYGNEAEVGAALADHDGVFVTTKVPPDDAGNERATLLASLDKLGLARVDLWLLHWPAGDLVAAWRALLQARTDGLTVDVGVSNFTLEQLDEVHAATGEMPAVNQIEWSPLLFDRAVLDGHRRRGVVLEGYSALRRGTLDHEVVVGIAERLERTPAQVLIRWHLQHGVVVIPKSAHPERIEANADVGGWALSGEDLSALDALAG